MKSYRRISRALLFLATVVSIGVAGRDASAAESEAILDDATVVQVADDDPEMEAAVAQARATIDRFIEAIQNPGPSQSGFSVKTAIKDGEKVEHMWLYPLRFEDGKFIGRINNDPQSVTNVKFGDEVVVATNEISDWLYREDGRLRGGHTIRVLLKRRDRSKDEGHNGNAFADRRGIDDEKLLGRWRVVSVDRGGGPEKKEDIVVVISEGDIRFLTPAGETKLMGRINRIDASESPKHLDLKKGEHLGLGIYELEGKWLKLIVHNPGLPRPMEFKGGKGGMVITLQREAPQEQ